MPRKGSPSRLRFPAAEIFDEVLSKSAFARFLKCDPSRITQMVRAGTIAPPALTAAGLIVAALALKQMRAAGCFADADTGNRGAAADAKPVSRETYDQARTRLAVGQADAQELKNETRRREVVDVGSAVELVGQSFTVVRTKLLAVPSAHAAQIARLKTPAEVEAYLSRVLAAVLEELSDDRVAPLVNRAAEDGSQAH